MIPVPGPVAPPYCPLLPDLESFMSMLFTPFWMQDLIFPWYLHQFGWRTSFSMVCTAFWMQNLIFPGYSQYLGSNSLDPRLFMPTVFGIENDSIALNNIKS